ncbi:MAG: 2OG-Fe(II) oxygenase [Flavobacteriales bacterium]|jgi:SM-20-related protein
MFDLDFFEKNGFVAIDAFIQPADAQRIREHIAVLIDTERMKKAGIGKEGSFEVDTTKRGDFIHWIEPQDVFEGTSVFLEKLNDLIQELNRNFYLGLRDFESHYTQYPEGTRYMKHSDKHKAGSSRVISFVLYLNEDWKESDGGHLRIYQEDETYIDILPENGKLAIFLSDKLHEVLETKRVRNSITGWILNEKKWI